MYTEDLPVAGRKLFVLATNAANVSAAAKRGLCIPESGEESGAMSAVH